MSVTKGSGIEKGVSRLPGIEVNNIFLAWVGRPGFVGDDLVSGHCHGQVIGLDAAHIMGMQHAIHNNNEQATGKMKCFDAWLKRAI